MESGLRLVFFLSCFCAAAAATSPIIHQDAEGSSKEKQLVYV